MSDFPFLHADPGYLRPSRPIRSMMSGRRALIENLLSRYAVEAPANLPPCTLDEPPIDPIMKAVEGNDKNSLIQILRKRKREPLPLLADDQKWTALHLAASKPEYKEYLELLFQYDSYSILVNKDIQTDLGETALHIASKNGCEENVLILLQRGCDPEKKTCDGYSALHIAASNGNIKIVRYLLNYFVNIDSKDEKGCTPLHLSVKAGYSDITGILLANGANTLSVDLKGNFPLHMACKYGNFEDACLLWEHNSALLNDKNADGITPFMLAVERSDMRGIKYFLENGAKTDIGDNLGRMAIHFAATLNHIETFSLLIQSVNADYNEQHCVSNFLKVLNHKALPDPYTYDSFTCLSIRMGPYYLNMLLNSRLPKSILQMPSLLYGVYGSGTTVFSPLAFLFLHFVFEENVAFDQCLDLLLKHEITVTDEFQRVLQTNWPDSAIKFVNPLSILISNIWPNDNREHYFNLLVANKVTTDYCLQCYHNNEEPFVTFNDYRVYYGTVMFALEKGNIEVLKFLISNSVILEPDILCTYLIIAFADIIHPLKDLEKARTLYQYLITLKPVYYKWHHQSNLHESPECPFLPAAEKFSYADLDKFFHLSDQYQEYPLFYGFEDYNISRVRMRPIIYNLQSFPYITAAEEFASVTLQQLCRTTIRQQLRETTLEDNLRNFRRKILELPLPKLLKDYLLFKN